jgi:hypothetical protein
MGTGSSLLKEGLQWDWDTIRWWPFRLDGDELVADLGADRVPRSGTALDAERRLYLRLTDLVVERPNGDMALRRNWHLLALQFANTYFPPVANTLVADRARIPVARLGEEALLLWWAVRLKSQLEHATPESLEGALRAAVQIRELFPDAATEDATGWCIARWLAVFTSVYPGPLNPRLLPPEALSEHAPPEVRNPKALKPEQWASLVRLPEKTSRSATAAVSLGRREAGRRVARLREEHAGSELALWRVASVTLATLMNLKLVGVFPTCQGPTSEGSTASASVGFRFVNPLARIWYGLWENMAGVRISTCERSTCRRLFMARQDGQLFCQPQCGDAERQRRKRVRDNEKRQPNAKPRPEPRSQPTSRRRPAGSAKPQA